MKKKYKAKKEQLDEAAKVHNIKRKKYFGKIREPDVLFRKRIMKEIKR